MARQKFKTLTEQMLYVLLALQTECYGADSMERVRTLSGGRVVIGAGTLYTLLDSFVEADFIRETRTEGRKRCYCITPTGREALRREQARLRMVLTHLDAQLDTTWQEEESL